MKKLTWNTLILGFLIGLITLIRPVNLLVLLFFVLWGIIPGIHFEGKVFYLLRSYKWLILAGLTAFSFCGYPNFLLEIHLR